MFQGYFRVGEVRLSIGQYSEAITAYTTAQMLQQREEGKPDPVLQQRLQQAHTCMQKQTRVSWQLLEMFACPCYSTTDKLITFTKLYSMVRMRMHCFLQESLYGNLLFFMFPFIFLYLLLIQLPILDIFTKLTLIVFVLILQVANCCGV